MQSQSVPQHNIQQNVCPPVTATKNSQHLQAQQAQVQQVALQDNLSQAQQMQAPDAQDIQQLAHLSRKQKVKEYVKREVSKFFGVDMPSEERERIKWSDRQRRLALRRFGTLKPDADLITQNQINERRQCEHGDRPDILPADNPPHLHAMHHHQNYHHHHHMNGAQVNRRDVAAGVRRHPLEDIVNELDMDDEDDDDGDVDRANEVNGNQSMSSHLIIERKSSVPVMIWAGLQYAVQALSKKIPRSQYQWSRSFAPQYAATTNTAHFQSSQHLEDASTATGNGSGSGGNNGNGNDLFDGLTPLPENEVFFDSPNTTINAGNANTNNNNNNNNGNNNINNRLQTNEQTHQLYFGERSQNGWRTRTSVNGSVAGEMHNNHQIQQRFISNGGVIRGNRISSQILDGVLDNSRRPKQSKLRLLPVDELDDRYDHRPYFTYWINTVQIVVLCLALICYGFGPIGVGMEQKNGQVLVTTLSLQQVQYQEARNIWLGPRGDDLVHLGAKFAACMRRDLKVIDVMAKTRRQERETACCIRNDDSGCVQSSQADCSVRGLWPTVSFVLFCRLK